VSIILVSITLLPVHFWALSTSVATPGPRWTHTGATIIVDEDSLKKFEAGFPSIYFKGTNIGDVRGRANIVNPKDDGSSPGWNRLEITYKDQDGSGTTYRVLIKIFRVDKITGVYYGPLVTFDSNSYASPVPSVQYYSLPFTLTFDFSANAYWIMITLTRSSTANNPTLYFLGLSVA